MSKYVFDVETDGLDNPSKIHCVCLLDLSSNTSIEFKGPVKDYQDELLELFVNAEELIGHNIIAYDLVQLGRFIPGLAEYINAHRSKVTDTLVLSRLLWQDRPGGHSLESWGDRLKYPKLEIEDFSELTPELLARCHGDVELNRRVYDRLMHKMNKPRWVEPIKIEMEYQWIAREMHDNGFKFNFEDACAMLAELEVTLNGLDEQILKAFPPRIKVTELKTKTKIEEIPFNPASPKQLVDVLWEGGWKPTDKTKGHNEALKHRKQTPPEKLKHFARYGWKVNEVNVETLPDDAAPEYQLLVERMLTEARKRTLTEWLTAYNPKTGRIHGQFNPLGTRTQRCVHTKPNMGNVPTKKSIKYNSKKLRQLAIDYGARMRSMWIADEDTYLCGCDMESAHLRIFGHLIDDKPFIESLISGSKENGTDPHSLNQRAFGPICPDRDRAKTGIFTYLNGGGAPKFREIFNCSNEAAKEALDRLVRSYPGLERLKRERIPKDAKRGFFEGIDGRLVINDSEHHMIGMYLQNMESVLMKYANVLWRKELNERGIRYKQINFVHDEFVTEVYGDKKTAELVGQIQADAIKKTGQMFNLNCPMSGEWKIGKNWLEVH